MYVVCVRLDDDLSSGRWYGLAAVGTSAAARAVATAIAQHLQLGADQVYLSSVVSTKYGWDVCDADTQLASQPRVAAAAVEFLGQCGRAAASVAEKEGRAVL
jgi:hypothetical protein